MHTLTLTWILYKGSLRNLKLVSQQSEKLILNVSKSKSMSSTWKPIHSPFFFYNINSQSWEFNKTSKLQKSNIPGKENKIFIKY